MVLPAKGLAAHVARKWTFVRVRSFVDEQIVAFGEVPGAVLANELLLGARCSPRHSQKTPVEDAGQERAAHAQMGYPDGSHVREHVGIVPILVFRVACVSFGTCDIMEVSSSPRDNRVEG